MPNLPEKIVPTQKLKKQLLQELAGLSSVNKALKAGYGPGIEQKPVMESVERVIGILEQLQARKETIKIPIRTEELSPELWGVFASNKKVGRFFEQATLKEELLKKHGREKLERYKTRKRRLQRPALHKKKPF